MDPLSKISRLSGLLRQQLAKQAGPTGRARANSAGAKTDGKPPSRTEREALVRTDLLRRIRSIDGDDEQKRRKVIRYFIEGVLASELGEKVAQGPVLHELTREVQAAMEADPEIKAELNGLAEAMIKAAE